MSRRVVTTFNIDDESMVGDVINATRAVFSNNRKKQSRKVTDYPDDIDIDSADDGPSLNEIGDEDSLAEEEMSNLKKGNQTLDSIFKRLERNNKKKVVVRAKRASILPRVTRALSSAKSRVSKKQDEGSLTWDEEEVENYEPDMGENEDVEAEEYEDLDRPRVQETLEETVVASKKKGSRLVYLDAKLVQGRKPNRSIVRYVLPRRSKGVRTAKSRFSVGIKHRVHIPIANRISFDERGFSSNYFVADFGNEDDDLQNRDFPRQRNRTIGGRIGRKDWPTPNRSKWDEEPIKAWAREKLRQRASEENERFQPWLKCVCNAENNARHKHKGRGFTMSGRLHAFD